MIIKQKLLQIQDEKDSLSKNVEIYYSEKENNVSVADEINSARKKFSCGYCEYESNNSKLLSKHMLSQHREKNEREEEKNDCNHSYRLLKLSK